MIEVHHGVIYETRPVVCERHPYYDYANTQPGQLLSPVYLKVTVSCGMISSERGLICPMCYGLARYATDDEVRELEAAGPREAGA